MLLFAGVGEGIYTVLESLARISTEINIYYVRSFKSANCPQVVGVGRDPPPSPHWKIKLVKFACM